MTMIKNKLAIAAFALTLSGGALAAPVLWVDDSSGVLGTVDVATGAVSLVGTMKTAAGATVVMTDIAFDSSGNLWGITFLQLYQINKTTAQATLVGNLGSSIFGANSLVFAADGTLYTATTSLYTVSTSTGAASLIGGGGYSSSGDLAFVGGNLYLSSIGGFGGDALLTIDTATGFGTNAGNIGFSSVFGLATDNNIDLYGVAGTSVLGINLVTGAGTSLVNYGGQGLGAANGTAFLGESGGGSVPEPSGLALMGLALAGLGLRRLYMHPS